ncbi:MAG: hypothetical protein ABJC61_13305 [Acidobacteriota bacterium]
MSPSSHTPRVRRPIPIAAGAGFLAAAILRGAVAVIAPSRPPVPACAWETISDPAVGLAAWVQRCDLGFRKIDFLFQGRLWPFDIPTGGRPIRSSTSSI